MTPELNREYPDLRQTHRRRQREHRPDLQSRGSVERARDRCFRGLGRNGSSTSAARDGREIAEGHPGEPDAFYER